MIDPFMTLVAAMGDVAAGRSPSHALEEAERAEADREARRETLPTDMGGHRATFEAMGIKFGEALPGGGRADVHPDRDPLFVQVTLPPGWKKERTDHSMWTKLVDAHGRERAMIFYKGAFYDRSARISPSNRYRVDCANEDWEVATQYGVFDGNSRMWATERLPDLGDGSTRDERRIHFDKKEALRAQAVTWLNEHFPDWANPLAYWDEP